MACILEELENTLKKQLGNTKNSKEFKDGATKAKERVEILSTLLNEVGVMKKVMKGQVTTEVDKDSKENKEIVHISSNTKGLGGALTNPTELSKKKGNIEQDYSITYKDKDYISVEAAYQANKVDETKTKPNKSESANYNLMVELITEKLRTYPKLVNTITKLGGLEYLAKAVHQPTKQNTVWETGGKDWFIDALKEAYTAANLPDPVKFTTKGFNGYVSIKNTGGKGSVDGDAKDKAMREVADGFVGEIESGRLNNSSTGTSYKALKDTYSGNTSAGSITYYGAKDPSVVMLARNGSFKGKELNDETKEVIKEYFENGAKFVVGDMPRVDSQFIDYLDEIEASYKIYHTDDKPPRIVKDDIKYDNELSMEDKMYQLITVYKDQDAPKIGGGLVEDVTRKSVYDEDAKAATMIKGVQDSTLKDMLPKVDGKTINSYEKAVNAWYKDMKRGIAIQNKLTEFTELIKTIEYSPELMEELGWSKESTKQEADIIVPTETFQKNVNRKIECKE